MLVGEEQDLVSGALTIGIEGPSQNGLSIRTRAHCAPVSTHKGFQGCRRVHVGNGDNSLGIRYLGELSPSLFNLIEISHVGHRAAGVQIRQNDLLVVGGQDVGGLGHEVDATKYDDLGLACGSFLRETEAISGYIGEDHDLLHLIMVTQNHEAIAKGSFC